MSRRIRWEGGGGGRGGGVCLCVLGVYFYIMTFYPSKMLYMLWIECRHFLLIYFQLYKILSP